MTNVIDEYSRRPSLYELRDGTNELMGGILFLAIGLGMWLPSALQWICFGAALAVTRFGPRFIRRRLVYPRGGYIAFRKRPWIAVCSALSAAVVTAAMALFLAKGPSGFLPLAYALLVSLGMLFWAARTHMPRFAAYAATSVAGGLALYFMHTAWHPGMTLYFSLMGTAFLIGGGLTLFLYVRRTPRHAEAEG
jgi:hypothetical protein